MPVPVWRIETRRDFRQACQAGRSAASSFVTGNSIESKGRLWQTSVVLILANLIPLAGALWWSWSIFEIVLLYWAENLIVGFFTLHRIFLAGGPPFRFHFGRIFLCLFFLFHYGMFCFVHGGFVYALLGTERIKDVPDALHLLRSLQWALLAIFLSHGYSFVRHFLAGGESARSTPPEEMHRPYPRMAVLHVAILLGAFAIQLIGAPMLLLVVLVLGKTGLDFVLHRRSHLKRAESMVRV